MSEYTEIREELAGDGYELSDKEYGDLLAYARRKAENAGKDESYIPLLLPDVIREHFMGLAINALCTIRMQGNSLLQEV